jgi:SAM-dependent methyltransferase
MSPPSPLSLPEPWDLVAPEYAAELMPTFARYSEEALRLAAVGRGARVLDVAAGPGTLSLLAAAAGAQVSALDFSPAMVAALRERADAQRLPIDARQGDGQALPWADGSFDAAFSMFGLIFFPDRARGLRELARVLAPGGVALISSWPLLDRSSVVGQLFGAIREAFPMMSLPAGDPPLGTPEMCRAELGAAGLREVEVREVVQTVPSPSTAELWASFTRTTAPLRLLRARLPPEEWERGSGAALDLLQKRLGAGPQQMVMPALLSLGRC